MDLKLLYREEMLDHVKNPRNMGEIPGADLQSTALNISCGDEITLFLKLDSNKISDFKYQAKACAVSIASASMLSEKVIGMNLKHLLEITDKEVLDNFYGSLTPSRQKCALLILEAIKNLDKVNAKN